MKHLYLDCSCSSLNHLVRFSADQDSTWPFFCITYHLVNSRSFWKRAKEAARHLLGRDTRWGDWDETLLDIEAVKKLRDLCDHFLKKERINDERAADRREA